jgi:protein CpxP
MKKIALLFGIVIALGVGNTSYAQKGGKPPKKTEKTEKSDKDEKKMSPEERAAKRTESMKTELGLSDQQTNEVAALNLKHAQEMDALQKEMEALKAEMKKKKDAHKTAINAVLTDEQRKLLEQKEQEHKENKEGEEEHED